MKTSKQISDELIYRLKTNEMKFYNVNREVGSGWLPNGTTPFNIRCRNGVATFTVYALSQVDAEDQVSNWLEKDEDE